MEMKLAPASLATALATSVLPQPGGPYSSTPAAADRPMAANCSGYLMGCVMEKDSSSRICRVCKQQPSQSKILLAVSGVHLVFSVLPATW